MTPAVDSAASDARKCDVPGAWIVAPANFVSHPMISEHWDERCRRNVEASAPTKARSEPHRPCDRANPMVVVHSEDLQFSRPASGLPSLPQVELAMGRAVCNDLGLSGYLRRTLYTLRAFPVPCAVVTDPTRTRATSTSRLIP